MLRSSSPLAASSLLAPGGVLQSARCERRARRTARPCLLPRTQGPHKRDVIGSRHIEQALDDCLFDHFIDSSDKEAYVQNELIQSLSSSPSACVPRCSLQHAAAERPQRKREPLSAQPDREQRCLYCSLISQTSLQPAAPPSQPITHWCVSPGAGAPGGGGCPVASTA